MKRPMFIDCDPGLDDFMALLAAFRLEMFDVVGLAAVCGNRPLSHTARNLAQILELAGKGDVPYALGAACSLTNTVPDAAYVHGETGLGTLKLPPPALEPVEEKAWELLYKLAKRHAGQLWVVALGPLTNLARAFLMYPELKTLVAGLTIMGGGHQYGNSTPAAEFNIYSDPQAAHIVFSSGVPLTMVGLDATMQLPLGPEDCEALCPDTPLGRAARTVLADNRKAASALGLGDVAHVHDLMAMVCAARPELFDLLRCRVDIELRGEHTRGQTVCDVDGLDKTPAHTRVAMGVRGPEYMAYLKQLFAGL